MTVSNTNNKVIYAMDGSTLVYAVPFKFTANSDLVVKKVLFSSGAETVLALTTNYTLTGAGDANGGELTLVASIDATYKLVIERILPIKQEADYVENDPFPAETHEKVADRGIMIAQQQQSTIDRCIKIGSAYDEIDVELPMPVADAIIGWNSDGTGLENKEEQGTLLSQTEAARDAAQAAQASVNLPTITGQALKFLQVNAGATGYQLVSLIADTFLAVISTAGKVLGSALASLGSVPSNAGQLPAVNGGVATGTVHDYGGTSAPQGYLLCDGSAVNRTTYAALFAVIGETFGAGNGTTTFNVPDTRDRNTIGKGPTNSTLGANVGVSGAQVTLVKANLPPHKHQYTKAVSSGNFDGSSSPLLSSLTTDDTEDGTNDGLNSTPFSVLNPGVVFNKIIKT